MNPPTYLDEHRPRPGSTVSALALVAGRAPRVTGLRIDTDGRLREILVPSTDPWSAIRAHVGARPDITAGGAGVETLDVDLAMWFDEDGAEHARPNPTASVAAAMFGRPGPVHGPVVFTGWTHPQPGSTAVAISDVSVAATLLLAGIAPTCDPTATTVDRAAEFARLDVDIVPAPRAAPDHAGRQPDAHGVATGDDPHGHRSPGDEPAVSYDAQAHTVTTDGDLPRCAECGEHAPAQGHPEHQPEGLAESDGDRS